jgi:hypothetical protein
VSGVHFKTAAFNRSATSPSCRNCHISYGFLGKSALLTKWRR